MFQMTTAAEVQNTSPTGINDSISIKKSSFNKFVAGAFAILITMAIGFGYWFYSGSNAAQIESIAVMPFVNESGNQDIEYLSDGMTETLISTLTEIPNLSVKASSTVFYYKGKNKTPKEIGEELGVEAVLLGKILQRNDDLTLRLELVDSKTLDAIWSETYNRKTSDIVSLQSEIARNVSDKLRLKLTATEQKQVAKTGTLNYEAQQLYLKGRFHWNKRSVVDLQKAIGYFKQSIEKDPGYALAYVGLADSYAVLPGYGAFRPKEYGAKTKQAADKALELENDLAEAHASLGHVLGDEYDWEGAEREYKKAIELNPNYSTAHHWYAMNLGKYGLYDEALNEISKALELDPLSRVINRNKAYLLYGAARYDEAIAQFKKTIELFPDDIQVYDNLSRAYAAQEKYSEAVKQLLIKFKVEGMPPEEIEKYKKIYQENGWKGFCRKQLEDHLKHRQEVLAKDKDAYSPDADLGLIYARLGDKEKAIEYLTKGYEERDDGLKWLRIDHEYDFLRNDPRFKELVRKIGLSE
jgi:TolB-like protein/Flp pilus assembly protein TadD